MPQCVAGAPLAVLQDADGHVAVGVEGGIHLIWPAAVHHRAGSVVALVVLALRARMGKWTALQINVAHSAERGGLRTQLTAQPYWLHVPSEALPVCVCSVVWIAFRLPSRMSISVQVWPPTPWMSQ
eukprot:26113-Prymnesium_polylepis.1